MKKYDVVIVGSGVTSLSAALCLAVEGLKVGVVEKEKHLGGQTYAIPWIGNVLGAVGVEPGISGDDFIDVAAWQCEKAGVEFLEEDEVIGFGSAKDRSWVSRLRSGFTLESPVVMLSAAAALNTVDHLALLYPTTGSGADEFSRFGIFVVPEPGGIPMALGAGQQAAYRIWDYYEKHYPAKVEALRLARQRPSPHQPDSAPALDETPRPLPQT